MNDSFFSISNKIILFLILFSLCICFLFIPVFSSNLEVDTNETGTIGQYPISPNGFVWPIPGFTKITSPYGKRPAPTGGASTFHKGIDIGATQGSNLIASVDGEITFTDFLGGGGYTVTLSTGNMKISYCHVSPNFLVKKRRYCKARTGNCSCWT